MSLLAISVITDGKNKMGFRLFDTETLKTKDVKYDSVYRVLKEGKEKIENIELKFGKIAGKKYSLNDLSTIDIKNNKYTTGVFIAFSNSKAVNGLGQIGDIVSVPRDKLVNEIGNNIISSSDYKLIIEKDKNGLIECHGIEPKDYNGEVIIKDVDDIKYNSFRGCKIKKLKICGRIKIIGSGAFENSDIEELYIDGDYIKIGAFSFKNCKLKQIVINNKTGIIRDHAFADCKDLEQVKCRVKEVYNYVFSDCKKLRYIDIEADILKGYCFNNCDSLKDINLDKVKQIEECFYNTKIKSLEFNNRCKITGNFMRKMTELERVNINKPITFDTSYITPSSNVEMHINCGINLTEICVGNKPNCKLKIYMNSKNKGFAELKKISSKSFELIDTNEDTNEELSKKMKKISVILGSRPEEYIREEWKKVRDIDDTAQDIVYTDKFKIESMGIEANEIITKELNLCRLTQYEKDNPDIVYEFIVYNLNKQFKKDKRLCNGRLYISHTNIRDKELNSMITTTKVYRNGNRKIYEINYWNRNRNIIGRLAICCSGTIIDFMALLSGDDYIETGNLLNKSMVYPFEYFSVGDLISLDNSNLKCTGKTYDDILGMFITQALKRTALTITTRSKKYYSNPNTDTRIVVREVKKCSNTDGIVVTDIENLGEVVECDKDKNNKMKKYVDMLLDDKIYNKVVNESSVIKEQSVYEGSVLYKSNINSLEDFDEDILLNLDKSFQLVELSEKKTVKFMASSRLLKKVQTKCGLDLDIMIYNNKKYFLIVRDKESNIKKTYEETLADYDRAVYTYLHSLINGNNEGKTKDGEKIKELLYLGAYYVKRGSRNTISFYIGFDEDNKTWLVCCKEETYYKYLPITYNKSKLKEVNKYFKTSYELYKVVEDANKLISSGKSDIRDKLLNGVKDREEYRKLGLRDDFIDILGYIPKNV